MPSALTELQCEKLHLLATAPRQEYIRIINEADPQFMKALLEILSNVNIFCDPLDIFLVTALIVKLKFNPEERQRLLLEYQGIIQAILAKVFHTALSAEAAVAILNHEPYDAGRAS